MLANKLFENKKIEKHENLCPFINSENPLYFGPNPKIGAVFSILVQSCL
jgi:hypothetical protein